MRDWAIGVWFAKWTEIPIHNSTRVMPHPKWVFGSDHGLSADATGAPAILLEDSHPQANSNSGLPIAWITAPATDASFKFAV